MARTIRPALLSAALLVALIGGGTISGKSTGLLPVPTLTLTRDSANSCGGNSSVTGCHRPSPFLTEIDVMIPTRVLDLNTSAAVTVTGTNTGIPGTRGGLAVDVTLGTLVAGPNTRVSATGRELTHVDTLSTGRSWTFNFMAGAQPGLVELYTAVNCVNGNGRADGGDEWALHSSQILASQTTPVRMFVNAPGVKSTGPGCDDGHGNHSVFGAATSPAVGNAAFALEAHGLPPSAPALLMLSLGGGVQGFDMQPLGAPGCVLRTMMQIQIGLSSGPGNAVRGEGSMTLPMPIPNDAKLKGLTLSMQIGAIDQKPKRSFPMVVTNGIELMIQ